MHRIILVVCCFLLAPTVRAAEWSEVFHDGFDQDALASHWRPQTGEWRVADGALQIDAVEESILRLDRTFDAPIVAVQYTCWFEADDETRFSDASCYIGLQPKGKGNGRHAAFYSVGGDYNTMNRIVAPALPPRNLPGTPLEPGKRYHVSAESNGVVVTLRVNGKIVSQEVMTRPLPAGQIALYVWSGKVRFESIRVLTHDEANRPDQIVQKRDDGKPHPNHPSHFQDIWKLSDLKTSDRDAAANLTRVPIHVASEHASDVAQPMTFGVPLPKEQVWRADQMRVVDAAGNAIPASITPTATWSPAGSLQWVLVDLAQPVAEGETHAAMFLEYGATVTTPAVGDPIEVNDTDDAITVDTGALKAAFSRKRASLIEAVTVDGRNMIDPASLYFVDHEGNRFTSDAKTDDYNVEVEFQTATRVVIKATGRYWNDDNHACRWIARTYLFRGSPMLKVYTTWLIDVDTDHMQWRDVAVRVPFANTKATIAGVEAATANEPVAAAQTAIRSYRARQGEKQLATGKHMPASVTASRDDAAMLLSVRELSGQFPAGLSADASGVTFHAFSPEADHHLGFRREDVKARMGEATWERFDNNRGSYAPMDTRYSNARGLAKTHELTLHFNPDETAAALATTPPLVMSDPKWNCATLAFGPFHPEDRENFPELENTFDEKLDEWIEVTTHLEPHYGFYDHGRGVPHHLKKHEAVDGEAEYRMSGYRRNYDLGYGNPYVPWLMYLRGMDRRWFDIGVRQSMYEMDVRLVHPTEEPARNRVGMKYWHYGVWSFDGSYCTYQDNWYWNLPLMFYTTGYQRAMDVYGEIATSVHNSIFETGEYTASLPGDRTARTSLLGSLGVYYKATWDPKARRAADAIAPGAIEPNNPDGRYNVRDQWLEYMFFHSVYGMPDPLPEVVEAYRGFATANYRIPERAHRWYQSPRGFWWLYQQTNDPQIGLFGRRGIEFHTDPRHFTFVSYNGFDKMWKVPVFMALTQLPGVDKAKPIETITFDRPHEQPIVIAHEQGKPTDIDIIYLGELTGDGLTYNDKLQIYELHLPADAPSRQIALHATAPPRLSEYHLNALTLPWYSDKYPLSLKFTGDNPVVRQPKSDRSWTLSGDDMMWPAGRFGRSVRLADQRELRIVSDEPIANGATGTIECWIRMEQPLDAGGYGGTVLAVQGSNGAFAQIHLADNWSATVWSADRQRMRPLIRETPVYTPGTWHHIAMQWDCNENGKSPSRFYLDGYPAPWLGRSDKRDFLPNAVTPAEVLGLLILGSDRADGAVGIDELRISDVERYPFSHVSERAFVPADAPFEHDEHTLLLYHAEPDEPATGRGGVTLETRTYGF